MVGHAQDMRRNSCTGFVPMRVLQPVSEAVPFVPQFSPDFRIAVCFPDSYTSTTTMPLLWPLAFMAALAPILLWQALWERLSAVLTPFSLWSSYIRRQRSTTQQACTSRHGGHLPPANPAQVAALIQSRRSIFPKSMTGATVSKDSIMAMLEAANWAPTHGHTEPWRFVVLGKAGMQAMQSLTEDIFRCQLAEQPVMLQVKGSSKAVFAPATQQATHSSQSCLVKYWVQLTTSQCDMVSSLLPDIAAAACAAVA